MNFNDPQTVGPLIGIAVAATVMFFRFGSQKMRPLRVEWMWVMPVIFIAMLVLVIWQFPPQGIEWAWLALALAVGAAIGWQRGRMMKITVDPETHQLNQQASPAAIIFLLALMAVRIVLRQGLQAEAGALHLSAQFVTDAFMVFALGLLSATRIEMIIRARRLLAEARGAGNIVA